LSHLVQQILYKQSTIVAKLPRNAQLADRLISGQGLAFQCNCDEFPAITAATGVAVYAAAPVLSITP